MELKLIHFDPDLMNLYGSYANLSVLRRALEAMGNTVTIETVQPGQDAALTDADFVFMGAGTEQAQKAALADFLRFGEAIKAAAADGCAMLFCGTAMELLGKTVTDAEGHSYTGIGLADFTSLQGKKRLVEDVYGHTALYDAPVVGFMNKCSILSGVETPLLTTTDMGFGNEGKGGAEGFLWNNVMGSHLTGPLLVKNPRMLDAVIAAIYARRGEVLPQLPRDEYAEAGYAVTAEQLKKRCHP